MLKKEKLFFNKIKKMRKLKKEYELNLGLLKEQRYVENFATVDLENDLEKKEKLIISEGFEPERKVGFDNLR